MRPKREDGKREDIEKSSRKDASNPNPQGIEEGKKGRGMAEELFDVVAADIKSYDPRDLISRSYVSNVEAQSLVSVAENFERAGETQKALLLYEKALDSFESGNINAYHTEMTIFQAQDAVGGIARLEGDITQAFTKLFSLCRKTIAPEIIARVAKRQERESKDTLGARNIPTDWKSMSFPENLSDLIDLLPDSPKVSREGVPEEIWRLSNYVQSGIEKVAGNTVKGIANSAVQAHSLGKHAEAEAFLKAALLIAQIGNMSIKKVMQGDLSASVEIKYDSQAIEVISGALTRMNRLEESVKLLLDHGGGNITVWQLSSIIPNLLKSDPTNPETLELTRRYLKKSDFLKSDGVVSNARILIALILNKQYGFVESGLETNLLDKPKEDTE